MKMPPILRLLLIFWSLAAAAGAQDIAAAATSPYELAKFVETHRGFEWKPLWKALHITDEEIFLPPCEESFPGVAGCSSELITIVNPSQTIVVLEHRDSMFHVFLRYQKIGADGWRCSGAYAPFVKYFRPEHRIIRFGGKPFLIVTGQGISGSGVSSKIESWIDLTAEEFEPVLDFMSKGTYLPFFGGVGRDIRGLVVSMTTHPIESVTVAFYIKFDIEFKGSEKVPIGERRDRVVYTRTSTRDFKLDPSLSTATTNDIEEFYEDLDSEFCNAELLRFNLKGLIDVAKSRDSRARSWLSDYLRRSPDTPESRQLKALLAAPR